MEASSDEHHRAMELMSRYEAEYTYNVEFLWRMAKCYRMMAQASSDEGVKKEKSFKGECRNSEAKLEIISKFLTIFIWQLSSTQKKQS